MANVSFTIFVKLSLNLCVNNMKGSHAIKIDLFSKYFNDLF